jgi:CubicO group peptidase (beta-lactamase class C family)
VNGGDRYPTGHQREDAGDASVERDTFRDRRYITSGTTPLGAVITVYSRKWKCLAAVCATFATVIAVGAPGEAGKSRPAAPDSLLHRVDELFAPWTHVDTPGCAVAVNRDGKTIYEHGYGMADIEHGVPISSGTVFDVGSVSKQFTAFTIYLLAQEGRLSPDDDVRKYLPELNDFGKIITIQHLLHHTSGLRDHNGLLGLAGRRSDDVLTEDDILNVVWRQKALNFIPGDEFLYSNTGYVLLGLIVQRVAGKSLARFAKERIFDPLGMRHTSVHENYGDLLQGRAYSYVKGVDDRYRYIALSASYGGAAGVFATVQDMMRWDRNLYDGHLGGMKIVEQMQVPALLNGDREISYASGFVVGRYRGLKTVEHDGANAGYRAELLRFPEQRLSVVLLCNADDVDPELQARKVADLFLGKVLEPRSQSQDEKPAAIKIDPRTLDALTGEYEHPLGVTITYTKENDRLMAQATGEQKFLLYPSGPRAFTYKLVNATVTFDRPGADGSVGAAVHHQNGRDFPMKRIHRTPLTAAELQDREGEFYSDELHVLYNVFDRDGELVLRHPRGEFKLHRGMDVDTYWADWPIGTIHYSCTSGQGCAGFNVTDGRVRNLWFMRPQNEFTAIKIDPGALNGLVGYYQLAPDVTVSVTRDREHLFSQLTGRLKYELVPSGEREYHVTSADFRVTFTADPQGKIIGLVVRRGGGELSAKRVDAATAQAIEEFPQRRQAENAPLSGSEATLRRVLDELRASPDFDRMTPTLAQTVRDALPTIQAELDSLGRALSVEFIGVGSRGEDVYSVHFSNGDAEWRIRLTDEGMLEWLEHHPFKEALRLPVASVGTLRTQPGGEPTTIEIINRTNDPLRVYWIDREGQLKWRGSVESHHLKTQPAYASELFMLGRDERHPAAIFEAVPGLSIGSVN